MEAMEGSIKHELIQQPTEDDEVKVVAVCAKNVIEFTNGGGGGIQSSVEGRMDRQEQAPTNR